MFYCEKCREESGWPVSMSTSHGKCEVCETGPHICWDRPSHTLPKHKRVLEQEAKAARYQVIHDLVDQLPEAALHECEENIKIIREHYEFINRTNIIQERLDKNYDKAYVAITTTDDASRSSGDLMIVLTDKIEQD